MVGYSYRIQVRQILVEKKEVAELLKETIREVKAHTKKVQTLMRLAEKYSICSSKEDGGNLGWIELSSDDPRGNN
ncbi:MAG: peptidylprolyl isomerase, partial [Nitrospinales bacterium]